MFVSLSQIPNIDFEGLFGNMQMVIKVSKQLLADLEISDAVGMSSRNNFFFFFFSTSWVEGRRRRAMQRNEVVIT